MVSLELKNLLLRNGMRLDYKQHLSEIVRNVAPLDPQGVPKRGFSDLDMTEAESLAEKIDASTGAVKNGDGQWKSGSLELTAEEAVHLAQKVERAEWPFSDKAFREFVGDVKALKSQ
jgi:hypothetical protein